MDIEYALKQIERLKEDVFHGEDEVNSIRLAFVALADIVAEAIKERGQ